MRGGD